MSENTPLNQLRPNPGSTLTKSRFNFASYLYGVELPPHITCRKDYRICGYRRKEAIRLAYNGLDIDTIARMLRYTPEAFVRELERGVSFGLLFWEMTAYAHAMNYDKLAPPHTYKVRQEGIDNSASYDDFDDDC